MEMIQVGNAQAFWGDRPSAAVELLSQCPDLDFLTMDYLAEVSMSILAVQRQRDARLGYAQDFVEVVANLAAYWSSGGKCRLIANAGGLNPLGCAQACLAALEKSNCRPLKIAIVHGDDVLPHLLGSQSADQAADTYRNLDSDAPLSQVKERLVTANAYMGCNGIVEALQSGADIVITGRVADPSMVVAPCVYHYGWSFEDWNRLAGATVAGHLLECGTHVTGGISTDWLEVPDPAHLGFPIAEIYEDGHCVITKSPDSGGHVTVETVKEQLIYEIGDPGKYVSPDVCVSFLELMVAQQGKDRVKVSGALGSPRPTTLKVSATYRDGFRAAGTLTVFGPQSVSKARRCGEIVLQRLSEAGIEYRDTLIECLGNAESVPVTNLTQSDSRSYETVLRMAVESDSKQAVDRFARELMPLVTAGPQGTTGYAEGRPKTHDVFRYWPCLIPANLVVPFVDYVQSQTANRSDPATSRWPPANTVFPERARGIASSPAGTSLSQAERLSDIAFGRSGDKGTGANVGILVRDLQYYDTLLHWLTADRVQEFFAPIGVTSVERFEMRNLGGINFIVRGILRRGLRNDAQGKALAQALLTMPVSDMIR